MTIERIPVAPLAEEARYTAETLAGVVADMVKAAAILNSLAPGGAVGQACLDAARAAAERLRATLDPDPAPPAFNVKSD